MTVSADILARCLESIRSGRMTIDDCVTGHPALADDLRTLLEVATSIAPPSMGDMDPIVRARGRAALIVAMAREKPAVTHPPGWRYFPSMLALLTRQPNIIIRMARAPALLVALIIVVTTALGGGVVAASGQSLPGDVLYPVKLTVENVEIVAATSDAAKAEIALRQASIRVAEIDRSNDSGRSDAIGVAAAGYIHNLADANRHVANAAAAGQSVESLAKDMNGEVAGQRAAIESAEGRAPASSRAALSAAVRAALLGIVVQNGLTDSSLSDAGGTSPASPTPTSLTGGTIPASPTATTTVGGTILQPPTQTATVGGNVPLTTPTETVEPSETAAVSATSTRTREVEPTENPKPTDTHRTPTAEASATSHPHGHPSKTPQATRTPGSGDDSGDAHGDDGHSGDGAHSPTPIVPTPVHSTATPKPTHPPEPTEKPEPTEIHAPTNTPHPTVSAATPTSQPTTVSEPTEKPAPTGAPHATNTPVLPSTPHPTSVPTPNATENSGGGDEGGSSGSDH